MSSVVFLAAIAAVSAIVVSIPSLASAQSEPGSDVGDDNPRLDSTNDYPLLEKLSDNGNYLVRLSWAQLPVNPDNAFDLQVIFLDPETPTGPNGTVAQPESNQTGSGQEGGSITVPDTQQNFVDVESYDITIYTNDGSILWQKMDQPGMGGAPGERILPGNYTGPVTIEITDIRPGGETQVAGTDSVEFSASIVPEFPLALVPLVAAAAGVVAILRIKPFRTWQQ